MRGSETLLITGLGPVGLSVALLANKLLGVKQIFGFDIAKVLESFSSFLGVMINDDAS